MKARTPDQLYETMAEAITYLHTHAKRRPSVAEVAKAVGMSPSRFEHAFAKWVGIAPKRFLAYLTKEEARELLKKSDVARASHRAGLSGASRLHDLMVTYEAVSPGELKKGDIEIRYGIHRTPFGWCVIGITKRGICTLAFVEKENDQGARKVVRERWPEATLVRDDERTKAYADAMFAKGKKSLHLLVRGTNFQVKVWEALLRIPPGQVATYGAIAKAVGKPNAVRAVGTACGSNALAYLIPCHRVLASDGGIGGYRWGTERKDAMLAWEAARRT